jgi:hypothetical protein
MRSDTPRVFIIVDDSTICEPRDQQEERRDRKRRRADDAEDKAAVTQEASFESLAPVEKPAFKQYERDEEYYVGTQQDDEHVVCLRDTLYKVRRVQVSHSLQESNPLVGTVSGQDIILGTMPNAQGHGAKSQRP